MSGSAPDTARGPGFGTPVWAADARRRSTSTAVEDGEEADLVVVGAGIMGLSTALAAARRGLSVRVIEAGELGQGASGLNGGQVIPGLKYDPDTLLEMFGGKAGEKLIAFAAGTADSVFALIEREGLDVPHQRNGWIQAAHTETALRAAERRDAQWGARGVDNALLDAGQIAEMTGARGYVGGWLDKRAGVIDPLAYVMELGRVAAGARVRIATGTRVTKLARRDGSWTITTASAASVKAKSVVVAANAYSDDLVPGLARSIVTLNSFQVATAPLPKALAAAILPGGQAVSDSRRILVYFRKTPDGRLMLGGRGRMSAPRSVADWAHIERAMHRVFPALKGTAIERRWFGRVAMTPDHLPHLHQSEPRLITVVGCQGRGVGLMTALGGVLGAHAASGDTDLLPFPVTPIKPIPLHGLRQIGVAAMISWYRLLDALER